jgi:dihydroxy-acid dehydratase
MADDPPTPARKPLRSTRSYGKLDRDGFIHRSWMKGTGVPRTCSTAAP